MYRKLHLDIHCTFSVVHEISLFVQCLVIEALQIKDMVTEELYGFGFGFGSGSITI